MSAGKVLVIAEAGVNHNGSLDLAFKLAEAAKQAGADCVKFQTFKAEALVSRHAIQAEYQKRNTVEEPQIKMLKKLELGYGEFQKLKSFCDDIGICFISTPFDKESIEFLEGFDMPFWKIPSGEVTDLPYLMQIGKTGRPVIMSTGMCTMEEIGAAVKVLQSAGTEDIRLLHCNTEYPTPFEDVNLNVLKTLKERFGYEVGYSDHTRGIEVPIAAVALGATVIEKHFTLDRNMEGPDHKASLEPEELKQMTESIRHIEKALGSADKQPTESEKKNIAVARRSIVAGRKILKGELLTEENITTKRPGNGISPMLWMQVIGTKAIRDFEEDELIKL